MLETETRFGEEIVVGGRRLAGVARIFRWWLPGGRGGVVWSRPAAVVVSPGTAEERRLPIRDTTRIAQLTCFGVGALAMILLGLRHRRRG